MLRTWKDPWTVKQNRHYVGGEVILWPIVFVGPRIGLFRSVSGTDDATSAGSSASISASASRRRMTGTATNRLYYTTRTARASRRRSSTAATTARASTSNETAFYPTSGGQPHDLGALGGVDVVDVIDEGDRIAHVLAAPLGPRTACRRRRSIDWARRFDHMQQHTGQHLLSAVFEDLFGYQDGERAFRSRLLDARSRQRSVVTYQQLVAAEARANDDRRRGAAGAS